MRVCLHLNSQHPNATPKPCPFDAAVEEAAKLAWALPGQVMVLFQHPGDMVVVPAAWLHTVINIEPNLKVAVEVVRETEAALIPITHRRTVRHFGRAAARDYIAAAAMLLRDLGC